VSTKKEVDTSNKTLLTCSRGELRTLTEKQRNELQRRFEEAAQSGATFECQYQNEKDFTDRLNWQMEALKSEVKRLSVRPYDLQKLEFTRTVTDPLQYFERDLLRFLILNGDSRGDAIILAVTGSSGGLDLNTVSRAPIHLGLVSRTEDHLTGHSTFSLNPAHREVLKDLLLPRSESKPPFLSSPWLKSKIRETDFLTL
jgi:hypothetical protein